MGQARLNHTPEGRIQVFKDHILYEIKMLQMTYRLLQEPWYGQWVGNALIESFCIHARTLIEFFEGKTPESGEKVCALHFTENSYVSFPNEKLAGALRGKLNAQIAHLSYQRAKDNSDKISPNDRNDLLQLLYSEIRNFGTHLRSPYKELWPSEWLSKNHPRFIANISQQSYTSLAATSMYDVTMTPNSVVHLIDPAENK